VCLGKLYEFQLGASGVTLVNVMFIQLYYNTGNGKLGYMVFFSVALRPNAGHGLLILEVSRSYTTTHHSR
jgi:hypothetical protein